MIMMGSCVEIFVASPRSNDGLNLYPFWKQERQTVKMNTYNFVNVNPYSRCYFFIAVKFNNQRKYITRYVERTADNSNEHASGSTCPNIIESIQ